MAYDPQRLPQLLASLYRVIDELEAMFPVRRFTPDGRMVDSLGVALGAYHYGITLHQDPETPHDGFIGSRQVQIRATQGDTVLISTEPEHLIVLRMSRDGTFEECFNGPGSIVWNLVSAKPLPKSGQHKVRLSQLRALMKSSKLTPEQKIARVNHPETFKRWLA